jgi:hypothetical protein
MWDVTVAEWACQDQNDLGSCGRGCCKPHKEEVPDREILIMTSALHTRSRAVLVLNVQKESKMRM